MDARRGWGFVEPQEKGLFTFYREQQDCSERLSSHSRDSPSFGKLQKLPLLTPTRSPPQPSYNFSISPSFSVPLHERVEQQPRPIPSPTSKLQRMRKLLLPLSQSAHKQLQSSPRSIVELTLDHDSTTQRRVKQNRHQKGKARTEVSPNSPSRLPHSTPLKQPANKNNDSKQDYLFDYFSEKHEPPFKMKAIAARLSSSKRVMKTVEEEPRHDLTSQRGQWSSLKPIVKAVPILPSRPQGLTVSFWDYFQERKKMLLGRYKRERAVRGTPYPPRRPKPVLTNNHI